MRPGEVTGMARARRGSRDDAAEAVEDVGRSRAARVPGGPSFALPVGLAAGLTAGVLAFIGVLAAANMTAVDPAEALDGGGVQAARMLAAPGADRWRKDFGSTAAARARAKEFFDRKMADTKDSRDVTVISKAIDEFRAGKSASGTEWRPGFDMIFPPSDPNDDILEASRRKSIESVTAGVQDAFLGAVVLDGGGVPIVGFGQPPFTMKDSGARQVGDTRIFAVRMPNGVLARQFEHPLKNRQGAVEGKAVVLLSAENTQAASPFAAAGIAALLALIGGFAVGFVMAMGPVKAMRRLAQDAEAIAGGRFDTRVAVHGPDVVQAAARNLQKVAAAAYGAASVVQAEPEIIQQQVMVQPVAEVQEGLAPSRNFKRPEEFEIEATQKTCPDMGNDYYDVLNVDDDNVGLLVADIPNMKGVRGALYMAQFRAIFRAVAPGVQSPADVLRQVNHAFAADLPRGIYVTAMYAIVSRSTGICKVASAQHLPLIFWKLSKKASARLAPEGIAVGLDAGAVFDKTIDEKAIQMEKGDRIVLFTDGGISARSQSGAEYGDERFYYVVNRESPKNSAACVNFVANDVDLFHEGAQQTDDFTILTLRRMR